MPQFFLHTSNNMNTLANACADVINEYPLPPLKPETIIVQSRGMEHWLSMELAKRFGVCTNINFPFPNAFLQELFTKELPEAKPTALFESSVCTLRIMRLLPDFLHQESFGDLTKYVYHKNESALYQLSSTIADVFDQYTMYRPELLREWETSENLDWQAVLWRVLVKDAVNGNSIHRAQMRRDLFLRMENGTFGAHLDYQRIIVFGISSLPPFHLELLGHLARYTDVRMFLLNPCSEFWTDIVSDKELSAITRRERAKTGKITDMHFDKGNSLLASLGSYGRDFLSLAYNNNLEETWHQHATVQDTMLHCIQYDIASLSQRGINVPKTPHMDSDISLRIHACHSQMREVEILHDQLSHFFSVMPDLLPKDIVVMGPDIQSYQPYIQAVFSSDKSDRPAIPFSCTDTSAATDNCFSNAFFSIISVASGRLYATQVLSLLDIPCIARKFSLSASNVKTISHWIKNTGIRWGQDAADKQRFTPFAFEQNTWKQGLDSLLAGFAMQKNAQLLFQNIFPSDIITGDNARLLGNFIDFMEHLLSASGELQKMHSFLEWSDFFYSLTISFLEPQATEQELFLALCTATKTLSSCARDASYTQAVSSAIAIEHMNSLIANRRSLGGYMNGKVTFCDIMPMRSVPFRIVYLLGMNDRDFPRKSHRIAWDLIALHPQKGDRYLEKEDRYLFLEAILSAQDCLHISFIGHSNRDSSPCPPSIVVSELIDYLYNGFYNAKAGQSAQPDILINHKLQTFSSAYFLESNNLFSFSSHNFKAAQATLNTEKSSPCFIDSILSNPPKELLTISPDDFGSFFSDPSRYFCKKRMGLSLDQYHVDLKDNEPFTLDALESYGMQQTLLRELLTGKDPALFFDSFRAQGLLPHGAASECAFAQLNKTVTTFISALPDTVTHSLWETLVIDQTIQGVTIRGQIGNVTDNGCISYRVATAKPKDFLQLWISHCLVSLQTGKSLTSRLFATNGSWQFLPIAAPQDITGSLCTIFLQGLSAPVSFFPKTSWTYATASIIKEEPPEIALRKCQIPWSGSDFNNDHGEEQSPYINLCFKNRHALDDAFIQATTTILEPLLRALEQTS